MVVIGSCRTLLGVFCMQNMLLYDKLHMFYSGVWGGHAWPLIQGVIFCLSQEKQKAFERRWEDLVDQRMNTKG